MPRLTTTQRTAMQLTTYQVTAARLIALPAMELARAVQDELQSNPALELVESAGVCAACGMPIVQGMEHHCSGREMTDGGRTLVEGRDPLLTVSAPYSLRDALLDDLRLSIDSSLHGVAEAVVGNLDDHGYLGVDPWSIALACDVGPDAVEDVIAGLRSIGPEGIGLRDSREWLLYQLGDRTSLEPDEAVVRRIVETHLDDLAAHRDRDIAAALRISLTDVQRARAVIRERLRPFSVPSLTTGIAGLDAVSYRVPDLLVHELDGVFTVEVLHASGRWLRIAPAYNEVARTDTSMSAGDREHVLTHIERARTFLRGLRERERTLQRIGDSAVRHQDDFLRRGVRYHLPLTRTQVAAELEIHVSTVSRAVSGKVVRLHDRRVIELADFFSIARDVREVLRALVREERHPYTDEQLAGLLQEKGFRIARRTVAKYRDELGIPSHRERLSAPGRE